LIDQRIQEEEESFNRLLQERARFAAAEDSYFNKAITTLVAEFEREGFSSLRQLAETTVTTKDDLIIEKLANIDNEKSQHQDALDHLALGFGQDLAIGGNNDDVGPIPFEYRDKLLRAYPGRLQAVNLVLLGQDFHRGSNQLAAPAFGPVGLSHHLDHVEFGHMKESIERGNRKLGTAHEDDLDVPIWQAVTPVVRRDAAALRSASVLI